VAPAQDELTPARDDTHGQVTREGGCFIYLSRGITLAVSSTRSSSSMHDPRRARPQRRGRRGGRR
jgi:hypothetical protein